MHYIHIQEQTKFEEDEKDKINKRAYRIAEYDKLDLHNVMLYKEVFDCINFT